MKVKIVSFLKIICLIFWRLHDVKSPRIKIKYKWHNQNQTDAYHDDKEICEKQ